MNVKIMHPEMFTKTNGESNFATRMTWMYRISEFRETAFTQSGEHQGISYISNGQGGVAFG